MEEAEAGMQLTVNGVIVEKNIWFAEILELCILGLGMLEQFEATVDTVSKRLHVSMGSNTRHGRNSLATRLTQVM